MASVRRVTLVDAPLADTLNMVTSSLRRSIHRRIPGV